MGQTQPIRPEYGVFCGPQKEGETQPIRHPIVGTGKLWGEPKPGIDTMYKVFKNSVKLYPNKPMFGMRERLDKDKNILYKSILISGLTYIVKKRN